MEQNSQKVLKHTSFDSGIGFAKVLTNSPSARHAQAPALGYAAVDRPPTRESDLGYKREEEEEVEDKKLPFACYRHDYSASIVGSAHFDRETMIHRPHEYTFKQFDKLHRSISNYKQQLHNLALAAEDMKKEMEGVCDAIPLSSAVSENESMIENIDYHIDLSQILANTCLNWEKTLEEQVEQPMTQLLRAIPVQAAQSLSRKSEQAKRRRDRSSNISMHGTFGNLITCS